MKDKIKLVNDLCAANGSYVNYSDQTRQGIDLLGQAVSPEEEAATRALYNQAQGGLSSTSRAAQDQLQRTLQGDYLGITPELQNYMDVIARRSEQSYNENVLPSLRAGYGRSGAFGGSDGYAVKVEIDGTLYYLMTGYLPEPEPEAQAGPSSGYKAKFEEPVIKIKSDNQKIKDLEKEIAELKELIKSKIK